jgi:hypothetical protein
LSRSTPHWPTHTHCRADQSRNRGETGVEGRGEEIGEIYFNGVERVGIGIGRVRTGAKHPGAENARAQLVPGSKVCQGKTLLCAEKRRARITMVYN